jgi:hypothetical protein
MKLRTEKKIAEVILLGGGNIGDVIKCKLFRTQAKSQIKLITSEMKLAVIEKIIENI